MSPTIAMSAVFFLFSCSVCTLLPLVSATWPCPIAPQPGQLAAFDPVESFRPQPQYQAEWYYVVGGLCLVDQDQEEEWWEEGNECETKVGFEVTTVMMNASIPTGGSVIKAYTTYSLNYGDKHYAFTPVGLSPIYPNPLQPFDLQFQTDPPLYTATYTLLSGLAGTQGSIYSLVANTPNMTINLILQSESPLMMHDHGGYVDHNSQTPPLCNTFDYVSMPRLNALGTIRLNDDVRAVNGHVWWDHQWGVFGKTELGGGWIWLGLRINDLNIMMEVPRVHFGLNYSRSAIEVQYPDGTLTQSVLTNIQYITNWTSPLTRFIYPVEMRIFTDHPEVQEMHIQPYYVNQEVTTILVVGAPQLPIWEGDVKVKVEKGNRRHEKGDGQLELVGFTRLG